MQISYRQSLKTESGPVLSSPLSPAHPMSVAKFSPAPLMSVAKFQARGFVYPRTMAPASTPAPRDRAIKTPDSPPPSSRAASRTSPAKIAGIMRTLPPLSSFGSKRRPSARNQERTPTNAATTATATTTKTILALEGFKSSHARAIECRKAVKHKPANNTIQHAQPPRHRFSSSSRPIFATLSY